MLKEGDIVVIWVDYKRIYLVKLKKGRVFGSDKGSISHDKIIGLEYGASITLSTGEKAYLLRPNPIYAYYGLKRPSQVLYPKDIAYIIFSSGIKPGDSVVEAGTGSGFLTIALAYYLGEKGKVYTYEIRKDMQEIAIRNVEYMGLSDRVIFKLKDIKTGIDEENVDAVILDMPDPWEIAPIAIKSLKPSASIVAFVPTINQLEKTYLSFERFGFVDLHAEELILREYQVKEGATRPKNVQVVHTGYIIRGRKPLNFG
jgi:tRNA (adenine57-N1/adenine58-N1)-methyltransferase